MHDVHALSGAYAQDALDDHEAAMFERHLDSCETCRAEVASLREAGAALTHLSATEPPPALRSRVLDSITEVRPLPPIVEDSTPRRSTWRTFAAAAAAIVVVGTGVTVWNLTDDGPDSSIVVSPVDAVLQAPDVETYSVDMADGAVGTIYRSVSVGRAVFESSDMPEAPAGHTWQLWLQSADDHMVPAGFVSSAGDQRVLLDGDASDAIGAGVTVEPDGGSDQPTTDPVALFDFST